MSTYALIRKALLEDPNPHDATYVALLRHCGEAKALPETRILHLHIIEAGRGRDRANTAIANLLLQAYGRCESLVHATRLFESIPTPDRFAWCSMVSAYARSGHSKTALEFFHRMVWSAGFEPCRHSLIPALSACSAGLGCLDEGKRLHAAMVDAGCPRDAGLDTALVHMYGKCRRVDEAWVVFSGMSERNVVAWTSMISACARNGCEREALELFRRMGDLQSGLQPNKVTFLAALNAVSGPAFLPDGHEIHRRGVASGLGSDIAFANALIHMYGKCLRPDYAHLVFDQMPCRDVISWNAVISAYAMNGDAKVALELFRQMELPPNKVTFINILSVFDGVYSLRPGSFVHERCIALGLDSDTIVGTALVNMYGKCGSVCHARMAFDKICRRNVITWTAMISAYARNGHCEEAFELYGQMISEGVKPNQVTYVSILDACTDHKSLENGQMIHRHVLSSEFAADVAVNNALIGMYGKCGDLIKARRVFDGMHRKDVISWTLMISTYARIGNGKDAFDLFRQMDDEGVNPNAITYLSVLEACAGVASLESGRDVHRRLVKSGLTCDIVLGTALIDMYGKCGNLNYAWAVFDDLPRQDAILWNAMIAAYAQNEHIKDGFKLFTHMKTEGLEPSGTTFLCILNGCSHGGLLDEGRQYFASMRLDFNMAPSMDHYVCMIDLFGRTGLLQEAEDLMNNMPIDPDAIAWMALLNACCIYHDAIRGARAAKYVFLKDPGNASPYVLLSNIYAAGGRWEDVAKVRKAMEDNRTKS